jgi:hypothetical protein
MILPYMGGAPPVVFSIRTRTMQSPHFLSIHQASSSLVSLFIYIYICIYTCIF